MKLTIFAATGGIGRQALDQAVGATNVRRIVVVSAAPIGQLPDGVRAEPAGRLGHFTR